MVTPPNAVDVEKNVIGAIMIDPHAVLLGVQILRPEDFYLERHVTIWREVSRLHELGRSIDYLTLSEALQSSGALEKAGGEEYLVEIASEVVSAANQESHCRIVKEKAALRHIYRTALELAQKAVSGGFQPDELTDLVEARLNSVGRTGSRREPMGILQVMQETVPLMERYMAGQKGIPTGLWQLDNYLCGWQDTDLILIGARPSVGKTALALHFVRTACAAGKAVAFFSLEMGREQLNIRMMCSLGGVSMHALRGGTLSQKEFDKAFTGQAAPIMAKWRLYVDDDAGLKIPALRSKCKRLQSQGGLDMVIIDYLQLMEGHGKAENRQQEVSQISRGLKKLAKELHVPVIALSQLNRIVEGRKSHRPNLSDLRESGALEQDADVVMFLHRDELYNRHAEPGKSEIILTKQRNGPIGEIEVSFNEVTGCFMDYDPYRPVNVSTQPQTPGGYQYGIR